MKSKKCILIVEDESSLRTALVDKFSHEGFTVLQAENGKVGLVTALKEHPDVILLDVIMPVMDGMTMLEHLRFDPWGTDARVIMLTNLSDAESVAKAYEQKSYHFLVKTNWSIAALVEKVNQVLS